MLRHKVLCQNPNFTRVLFLRRHRSCCFPPNENPHCGSGWAFTLALTLGGTTGGDLCTFGAPLDPRPGVGEIIAWAVSGSGTTLARIVPCGGSSPPLGAKVFPSWELLSLSFVRAGEVVEDKDLIFVLACLSLFFYLMKASLFFPFFLG